MSIILDLIFGILLSNKCSHNRDAKGVCSMSKNDMELIRLIREHDEPEKALVIAIEVITLFLTQHESFEEPAAACPQVPAGTDQ